MQQKETKDMRGLPCTLSRSELNKGEWERKRGGREDKTEREGGERRVKESAGDETV